MKTEARPEKLKLAQATLADAALKGHAEVQSALSSRSMLTWGEHCSECAFPSCYSTCSFYTPSSDFGCRRFEHGFEPLAEASDFKLIQFRRWGKVEAEGPVRKFEPERKEETWLDALVQKVNGERAIPLLLKRKLAYTHRESTYWKSVSAENPAFDAFVLETLSGDGRVHDLTLTILNSDQASDRLFQRHISASADYGRYVIDIADIAAHVDLNAHFLVQIEPMNEAAGRAIIFGFCDFVSWKGAALPEVRAPKPAAPAAKAKVLVWDLDETLWEGTLAEDGVAGLRLRPEAVDAIKALDERGVLHSIASKNDHALVMQALEHFGLAEYFLCPQVSWNPKSGAISAIASALNLGIDSFVFIDDQPFERAEVQHVHKQIRVLDHLQAASLLSLDCFDVPVTAEGRARRSMYRQDESRRTALADSGADYREFLASSGMTLQIEPLTDANIPRISELSQRTNQLNFNGTRYSEDEVRVLMTAANLTCLALSCLDNYGDYGVVGFVVTDLYAGAVAQFFMSCRVQKKRVEQAVFDWLRQKMILAGAVGMSARRTPTERNVASQHMLQELGFSEAEPNVWTRPLASGFEDAALVHVDDRTSNDDLRAA